MSTTAIQSNQFCTFYLNGDFFGIDVQKIQEVIRYQDMTEVPLAPDVIEGLINLRGQIVTAVDLRKRLGMPDRTEGELPMNVVVRTDEAVVSLLVDEIGDVLELDNTIMEKPPEMMNSTARDVILGVYKLENKLLLVLDTELAVQLVSESANISRSLI